MPSWPQCSAETIVQCALHKFIAPRCLRLNTTPATFGCRPEQYDGEYVDLGTVKQPVSQLATGRLHGQPGDSGRDLGRIDAEGRRE